MEAHHVITACIASAALLISCWNLWFNLKKDAEKLKLKIIKGPHTAVLTVTNTGNVPVIVENIQMEVASPEGKLRLDPFDHAREHDLEFPFTVPPRDNRRIFIGIDMTTLLLTKEEFRCVVATTAAGKVFRGPQLEVTPGEPQD